MAAKHNVRAVKEAIAALDLLDVPVPEIHRRLREDECDLGYKVDISRRTVYEHRQKQREAKRREETQAERNGIDAGAAQAKAIAFLEQQLADMERTIKPGKITAAQVAAVGAIQRQLGKIAKGEAAAEKAAKPSSADDNRSSSALEQLAAELRDQGDNENGNGSSATNEAPKSEVGPARPTPEPQEHQHGDDDEARSASDGDDDSNTDNQDIGQRRPTLPDAHVIRQQRQQARTTGHTAQPTPT